MQGLAQTLFGVFKKIAAELPFERHGFSFRWTAVTARDDFVADDILRDQSLCCFALGGRVDMERLSVDELSETEIAIDVTGLDGMRAGDYGDAIQNDCAREQRRE